MNWPTPRDVLAMNPNPAKLSAKEIAERFGICIQAARELRTLACRAPEVLDRYKPK